MSDRVSVAGADISACSGLMYSGVPSRSPWWVTSGCSGAGTARALTMPKSESEGFGAAPPPPTLPPGGTRMPKLSE